MNGLDHVPCIRRAAAIVTSRCFCDPGQQMVPVTDALRAARSGAAALHMLRRRGAAALEACDQPAKSSSLHGPCSRSRAHVAVVPTGLLAPADSRGPGGSREPEVGWRGTGSPQGRRSSLETGMSMPSDAVVPSGDLEAPAGPPI